MIFHLSYPKSDKTSVNACIPKDKCSVQYPDFLDAVEMCIQAGVGCKIAKSDMSSPFRHIPMKVGSFRYLILKAQHPETKVWYYFVDKCLNFGSSISCAIFQAFSNAVAYLVKFKTKKNVLNYLDDYLFAALRKLVCDQQVRIFLQICEDIKFPVALEKTFWGTTVLVFLGLLLDTKEQVICIPKEKVVKALNWVEFFLNKKNKKTTILQFQKLCGTLNFLCKCVMPGRAFLTRLYGATAGNPTLKQYHHIRITNENRLDLLVWRHFLTFPTVFCRPFMEAVALNATEVNLVSNASGSTDKGFGVYFGKFWTFGQWTKSFIERCEPSIEYLELFAVTVAVKLWIKKLANKKIYLFCDNQSVVHMINNLSSKCKNCMVLIRVIALESMIRNVRVYAKYITTKNNEKADSISRLEFKRFRKIDPEMNVFPKEIPEELWPVEKLWITS